MHAMGDGIVGGGAEWRGGIEGIWTLEKRGF